MSFAMASLTRRLGTGILVLSVVGCSQVKRDGSGTGSGSDSDPTTTPTPSPSPTPAVDVAPSLSCSSSVIDAGQKGSVATVIRGAYSDVKMIPGTTIPAVAFADASAVVIKLTYNDPTSGSMVTEVVSGDGTGAFVRLAFLSNKTPLVFWTLGTALKVAIRSAPLGSSGTWNAGVIEGATGTAPRAPEVSVNPLDQVAVTFLSDNVVGGRARFMYCDAPCTSPTGFQAMSTNRYIDNTNIVVGEVATGSAWCKSSANTYYPVAVYTVTGAVKYAVCLSANLANCLNGTNWSTGTVVATANLASKVYLDATVTGDVPKVATLGATGITTYRMGTTACTVAPAAFSAGTAMGAATSGTLWMSLMKDGSGKFHLVANEGTTSVRYYNSTTTDLIGAWNPAGIIEGVTVPAASAGGAAIDTSTGRINASYGLNMSPYDIKLSKVNDYTVASNAATFTRQALDGTGDLQLSAAGAQLKQIAVASTSTGRPAVAYVDFSVGAVGSAKLKYAFRNGASSTAWTIYQIPNTINPQFPGLAFDSYDHPWVSYYDASAVRFYLATNSSSDGSGSWTTYEFPVTPSGAAVALPAANNTAMTMYKHGGVSDPVMVVIDTNATSKGVKVAVLDSQTRTWRTPVTIDGLTVGALGAAHVAADGDASGNLVVAYQELNVGRVRYSYSAGGSSWSTPLGISLANQGQGIMIRINPATGFPVVSYHDQASGTVYVSSCAAVPSGCVAGGWTSVIIDSTSGVSAFTSTANQVLSTGLGFSPLGKNYVFYARGQSADGHLVVTNNFSGSYVTSRAASGVNGALAGAPSLNFAIAGWNVGIAPNAAGSFSGAYIGPGNWLYSLSCGD
ncbi:MAG: hypothetical protein JST16_10925 [Bdellovibrionales bacterium]|nr:hypothetical protein [Bdellovibrionales bacterium]